MKKIFLLVLVFSLFSPILRASMFGEENVALWRIVAQNARELEELLKQTKVMTQNWEQLNKIADAVDDTVYQVETTERIVENLKYLSGENPQTLADINNLIREIKGQKEDVTNLKRDLYQRITINQASFENSNRNGVRQERVLQKYVKNSGGVSKSNSEVQSEIKRNTREAALEQMKTNLLLMRQNKDRAADKKLEQKKDNLELQRQEEKKSRYSSFLKDGSR